MQDTFNPYVDLFLDLSFNCKSFGFQNISVESSAKHVPSKFFSGLRYAGNVWTFHRLVQYDSHDYCRISFHHGGRCFHNWTEWVLNRFRNIVDNVWSRLIFSDGIGIVICIVILIASFLIACVSKELIRGVEYVSSWWHNSNPFSFYQF